MAIHPGKMLDFMGNEFGQLREYDESREQDWLLLDYPIHEAFANYRRTLNELYRKYDAFWSEEYNPTISCGWTATTRNWMPAPSCAKGRKPPCLRRSTLVIPS